MAPAPFPFCLENLMQDSNSWLEKDIVDFLHPQLYRESFDSEESERTKYRPEVDKITEKFPAATKRAKFAPGIAFTANRIDLTKEDIINCVKLNRRSGFQGQIFFLYEGLRKHNNQMAVALREQANYDTIASLPSPLLIA